MEKLPLEARRVGNLGGDMSDDCEVGRRISKELSEEQKSLNSRQVVSSSCC